MLLAMLPSRLPLKVSPAFILSSSAGFYNVLLKMHSSFLIGGLSLIFCCQAAFSQTLAVPPTGPITLTLQDAMQRARQYEQQIYSANIAAQLAHEDTIQAKAALLPTAEGQSGYIYTQPNGTPSGVFVPNDGPHVYIDQLNVHADVYDPGKRADYRRTIAAEAVAKARRDIAERGLVATVSEDFYSMVAAQRKIVNAQASLKEARDFQDLTEKQERGGEAAFSRRRQGTAASPPARARVAGCPGHPRQGTYGLCGPPLPHLQPGIRRD